MILIVMEVVEEENPLQFYTEAPNNLTIKIKNCVGRPKKKSEIKFSPQPKSIISILLSKEKSHAEDQDFKNKIKNHDKQNESMNKNSLERAHDKSIFNEQNRDFQKDKLYKCNYFNCTYSTKFPSNLKMHKRIHTTEQQYICDECTFRSKFISSLKTHKRLHRDERPFACQSCDYKCNSCSNLKKHVARKHIKINNDK